MKPRVLVSLGTGRMLTATSEYQRAQEEDARAAASSGGLDLRLVMAKTDPALQMKQIAEAINLPKAIRPIAVVIEPAAASGYENLARAALQASVGWVLASDPAPYLDVLTRDFPGQLVAWTCVDNEEVGRLQAQLARALLPKGGKVLVLEGPGAQSVTIRRRRGLEEGIQGSELQKLATLSADWKPAGAEKAIEAWLQKAGEAAVRPDLLISQNDEMVVGARRALQAYRPHWGRLSAIGCDGLPGVGQKLVSEGILAATIINPTTTGPGVEIVARASRGEQVPPGAYIPIEPFPPFEELLGCSRQQVPGERSPTATAAYPG